MSVNEFMTSNTELDRRIAACKDPDEIKQLMQTYMVEQGLASNERGVYAPVEAPAPARPYVPAAPAADKEGNELFYRTVTVGNRTHLLSAYSCGGLDTLEREFKRQHGAF